MTGVQSCALPISPGVNEDTRYLYIPTCATFENVKDSLTHQGILKNINSVNWVSGMMEYPQSVKAGRYRITEGMNNRTLISKLRSGNQDALSLTFNNIRTKEQFAASLGRTDRKSTRLNSSH